MRQVSDTGTASPQYADRLVMLEGVWWKRLLPVQAPYRWNLRRHRLGRTLDVGCGVGRNLAHLAPGSVGVDHNAAAVLVARRRGLDALTVEELQTRDDAGPSSFDSILLAHVLEHLTADEARALLRTYLGYLRPGGRVLMICPQQRGYATDATHVTYLTGSDLVDLAREVGLRARRWHSFPFPSAMGRFFAYNEFTVLAEAPEPGRSERPRSYPVR
ncbi:MAG: class I SAM-dependent methyltransferase [Nocardioidaceae bacterium]